MIFDFLSNFSFTNDLSEFNSNQSATKIDLRKKHNHMIIATHSFLRIETVIVYYSTLTELKSFMKLFVIECGGGKQYEKDLDDIIDMNLGV